MEDETENRMGRAAVFSIGAALVITALAYVFADVVLNAGLAIAIGISGRSYPDAASLALATFVACFVGFLLMSLARSPVTSRPSDTAEKAQ